MRGVTRVSKCKPYALKISTHTPHARRDVPIDDLETINGDFNSHASCEA